MPNKVIVRSKKVEGVIPSESSIELRRLNAKLQHEDISEDELAHFGVIGQKWGVRREERDLNRVAGKAMKLADRNYLKVYNAMADESSGFYSKINSNPKYKNLNLFDEESRNSPLAKSYLKECSDAATESLQRNSDKMIGSKVDSRVKVTWYMPKELGSTPSFYVERADNVKHADEVDRIKLIPKFSKSGKLISMDFPKDIFEKNEEESELKHYGVIGQKWGIRKDFEANKSIRKSRAKMLRTKRLMSDDEMAKTVKRLEMEKKLTQLVADDVVPGRVLVASQMGKFMSSALGAAAGVVGAVIVKEALKSAGLKGD